MNHGQNKARQTEGMAGSDETMIVNLTGEIIPETAPTIWRAIVILDGHDDASSGVHMAQSRYVGDYDSYDEAREAAHAAATSTHAAHGFTVQPIDWCEFTPYRGMVIFYDKPPFVVGCYDSITKAENAVKRACASLKARGAIDWYIEPLEDCGVDYASR